MVKLSLSFSTSKKERQNFGAQNDCSLGGKAQQNKTLGVNAIYEIVLKELVVTVASQCILIANLQRKDAIGTLELEDWEGGNRITKQRCQQVLDGKHLMP